jgi:DNA-binding transcriptional regulator YiaG
MKTKAANRQRTTIRPVKVAIPTADGRRIAEHITVDVPMRWDAGLKQWLMDSDAMEMLDAAKTRHMGLMLPAELLSLRQRLGLSQRDIGELLRIGAKSWTRWETGLQRPSQVINLLLKLLDAGTITPTQLRAIGAEPADWSRQFLHLAHESYDEKPVSLDGLRSQQTSAAPEPIVIPA